MKTVEIISEPNRYNHWVEPFDDAVLNRSPDIHHMDCLVNVNGHSLVFSIYHMDFRNSTYDYDDDRMPRNCCSRLDMVVKWCAMDSLSDVGCFVYTVAIDARMDCWRCSSPCEPLYCCFESRSLPLLRILLFTVRIRNRTEEKY